jgi:hypothetical protein
VVYFIFYYCAKRQLLRHCQATPIWHIQIYRHCDSHPSYWSCHNQYLVHLLIALLVIMQQQVVLVLVLLLQTRGTNNNQRSGSCYDERGSGSYDSHGGGSNNRRSSGSYDMSCRCHCSHPSIRVAAVLSCQLWPIELGHLV